MTTRPAFMLGGPLHGEVIDVELAPDGIVPYTVEQAVAETKGQAKEWAKLASIGIAPPVGAFVVTYIRLGLFTEPVVYYFAGMRGDPEVLSEDEAEEAPDQGDPPSDPEG